MKNLKQLTLDVYLKDKDDFASFVVGKNKQLFKTLNNLYKEDSPFFIYFWGASGLGKSHLLTALCQLFYEKDLSAAYLPLEDYNELDLALFDNLESLDLLCIDDLHLIAGNKNWEEAVFHCFNKMLASGKKIVITGNISPQTLPIELLDLKSRINGGMIFALNDLDDEEKVSSLKLRAKLRGLELPDNVAHFLLSHFQRDTKNLFAILEKLDKAVLREQRKLTVPFVKDVLS